MTKCHYLEEEKVRSNVSSSFCRRMSAGDKVIRKYRRAMIRRAEYVKLKAIVPAVASKKSVTKLTVIEEAIKYINELHEALASRLHDPSINSDTTTPSSLLTAPHLFFRQLYTRSLTTSTNNLALNRTNEPDILHQLRSVGNPMFSRSGLGDNPMFSRSGLGDNPMISRSSLGDNPMFSRSSLGDNSMFSRSGLGDNSMFSRSAVDRLAKYGHKTRYPLADVQSPRN